MKISCTIDELRSILESCFSNRCVSAENLCPMCALYRICSGSDGIKADFEIIEIERRR